MKEKYKFSKPILRTLLADKCHHKHKPLLKIAVSIAKISEAERLSKESFTIGRCFVVSFAEAKPSILRARKKARLHMRNKPRSSPEPPLPSQKQAKLVLSTKSRFYPPKPVFIPNSGFFYLKPRPHQNRRFNRKNKQSLFLSTKSRFYPPKPVFIPNSGFFYPPNPGPHQNRRFHHKNKQSLFYPRSLFYLHKVRFYP